jgi:hypothetical protein
VTNKSIEEDETKSVVDTGCTLSIAIFTARESVELLSSTLASVLEASKAFPTITDIVVNGNPELAHDFSRHLATISFPTVPSSLVRLWTVSVPDKAYAWNQYVHEIWPNSKVAFFVDGYVQIDPSSLSIKEKKLNASSDAYAATGVPTSGRSAKSIRNELVSRGGIHGNLYAIKGDVVRRLRAMSFKLPIGIYRTDATLGAALSFSLDPKNNKWDVKRRIIVIPEVSWKAPTLSLWRIKDLKIHWKRMKRQAQGILVTAAVREHLAVRKLSPEDLPNTAYELITTWIKNNRNAARRIFLRNPLSFLAARNLSKVEDYNEKSTIKIYEI